VRLGQEGRAAHGEAVGARNQLEVSQFTAVCAGSNTTRGTKKERDGAWERRVGARDRESRELGTRLGFSTRARTQGGGGGNDGVRTSHGACPDMVGHAQAQPFKRPSPELKLPHSPLSISESKRQ